jgi:hypothetical protein
MAKVAKLVWVSVGTRVIVEENATDEQIWDEAEQRLVDNLIIGKLENLETIMNDEECPYDPENDDEITK